MAAACPTCVDVDLNAIFDSRNTGGELYTPLAADLKTSLRNLRSNDCLKCQFFVAIADMDTHTRWKVDSLNEEDALCLRNFSGDVLRPDRPQFGMLVGVVPLLPERSSRPFGWPVCDYTARLSHSGLISRMVKDPDSIEELAFQPRKVDPARADFEVAKRWLDHCILHHKDTCGGGVAETIPFFRLIDCNSRKVISLEPVPEYLALSYVWGPPDPECDANEHSEYLGKVPGVIEDAMQATLRLGYRYLWADRYCIYQGDTEKKTAQIITMDLVYRCAEVTLIAVCDDTQQGLPGAGRTNRTFQPVLEDDERTFLCTLPEPVHEIKGSIWMTRGWTFQEGFFSRRRLFFTEHQMVMECHSLLCTEVVSENAKTLNDPNRRSDRHRVFPRKKISQALVDEPWLVAKRIEEYGERNMTYDSDILNGIVSIFGRYRESENGNRCYLTHIWGVPVLQPPTGQWTMEHGFLTAICWRMHSNAVRRPDFPSWSWTGWKGHLWPRDKGYQVGHKPPYDIQIEVELANGVITDLSRYERLLAHAYEEQSGLAVPLLSPNLHLEAWYIEVRAEQRSIDGYWFAIPIEAEERYELQLELMDNNDQEQARPDERFHGRVLQALVIGNVDGPTKESKDDTYLNPFLIVVDKGPIAGTVQRVGMVELESGSGHGFYMDRGIAERAGVEWRGEGSDMSFLFRGRRRKKFILC